MTTTSDLLEKMKRCGLAVTYDMLVQDTRDGFLPQRGRGRGRQVWEDWAVRRAMYLYRLKKKGLRGQVLRVLLFYRDGWGWTEVKPICLAGLKKLIDIQNSPVRTNIRKPTPANVEFIASDAAASIPMNEDTAKFLWGLGLFGRPLLNSSIQPLFAVIGKLAAQPEVLTNQSKLAEQCLSQSEMTYTQMIEIVSNADQDRAKASCILLEQELHLWRRILRQHNLGNDNRGQSTNFSTLCGFYGEIDFRSLPKRITRAQFLAALLVPSLVMVDLCYNKPEIFLQLFIEELIHSL